MAASVPSHWMRPRAGSSRASRCAWSRPACGATWRRVRRGPSPISPLTSWTRSAASSDLDEQLLFRCSSRNLVELPPDADADPAPTPAKADDDGKDPASSKTDAAPAPQKKPGTAKAAPAEQAKTPAAKPKPKEAAKTAPTTPKAPAKDTGATSSSDKAAAAAKTKAKSKADDAYKPPPVNPAVDPFANAPARQ